MASSPYPFHVDPPFGKQGVEFVMIGANQLQMAGFSNRIGQGEAASHSWFAEQP